jgi:ectoine hydroxylase-related dioxygenase (phytanoyl-CoA dioxygenase family)
MSQTNIKSSNGRTTSPIDDAAVRFYQDHGYLILENALGDEQVEQLNGEAVDICRGKFGQFLGWGGPHEGQSDEAVLKQYLCVNFPHKIAPAMRGAITHRAIADTLTKVIGPNVKCMQSMLFIKAAGKPGQAWHQDEDYIPTRDRSLTGAWIALDHATVENGCLWVIPGSHKPGVLWPQRRQNDARFDCAEESYRYPYTDDDAVPAEITRGSILFFNGYLLHRSLPNTASAGYRRALVNHYMSAESLLPWKKPAPGQPIAKYDYRDIVMVAGHDPYGYLGTEDIARTDVRPSGEGGCEDWASERTYGGER